ncbi:MAG: hypothetical protein WBB30_04705 [Solirubrobacterales bacterium]
MQRDLKIRGYTVAQFPNAPLWAALVGLLVAALADEGTVHDVARAVFYVGITIWAYEEAANGVNALRRGVGIVGLVLIVISLATTVG